MSYRHTGCFKSLSLIVQTMCKPKPGFKICSLYWSQMYYFLQKKKKKVVQIEVMTYENGVKLYVGLLALTNVLSARVKTGNAENKKKRAALFLSCSFFGFKCTVERSFFQATVTAQRNKANERKETA